MIPPTRCTAAAAPRPGAAACQLTAILAFSACLIAAPALAHTVSKGLATITLDETKVQYTLQVQMSAAPPQTPEGVDLGPADAPPDYARLLDIVREQVQVSADGAACPPAAGTIAPPAQEGGMASIALLFQCPAVPQSLAIRDRLSERLGRDYVTIANIQWPGGSQPFVFQAGATQTQVAVAAGTSARGTASFFLLGVEHILIGYDHLLFLLMLILRGGNLWSLLKIITAFTVAHSITLALAALNVVALPEALVEAVIALSIAYVAAENLFLKKAVSLRWAVSFLFGLVHGFGFSNVLRELGLPQEGLLWSLLGFNLGVEAGQALAVLLVLPALLWLRKTRFEPRTVAALSAAVLVVGLALFVERLL
jgi:hypothetical protein